MKERTTPVIEARHLTKHFPVRSGLFSRPTGYVSAVDDISFGIETGRTLGVVGESGCGKTTTAKLVLKLEEPTGGELLFEGKNLQTHDAEEVRSLSSLRAGGVPGSLCLVEPAHAHQCHHHRTAHHQ